MSEDQQRKEKMQKALDRLDDSAKAVLSPLLQEVEFLEQRIAELKKLPHIRVSSKNPEIQKETPAGKNYLRCVSMLNNCIGTILRAAGKNPEKLESPLREYFEKRKAENEKPEA